MDNEIKNAKIDDLIPDDRNNNKGSEYGQRLVENSLRKFGFARSIVLDKNNRIISGNKTIENAAEIGLEEVIIVETTGDKIIAVKRTDIDLDTKRGRELALADNATAVADIKWDEDVIREISKEFDIIPKDWGIKIELEEIEEEITPTKKDTLRMMIEGKTDDIENLLTELIDRGFKCFKVD